MTAQNKVQVDTSTETVVNTGAMHDAGNGGDMAGFFIAGALINVVVVVAYFIWARRQWQRNDRP